MKLAILTALFCVLEIVVLAYTLPYLLLCQGGALC